MQLIYGLEASHDDDTFTSTIVKSCKMFTKTFEQFSSFDQTQTVDVASFAQMQNFDCPIAHIDPTEKSFHFLVPPQKEKCFNDFEYHQIEQMYKLLHPDCNITHISRFYHESKQMVINKEEFISQKSRSQRSTAIAAYWPQNKKDAGNISLKIGLVQSFFLHQIAVVESSASTDKTKNLQNIIAFVKWYSDHSQCDHIHDSVVITASVLDYNPCEYFPVSRIVGQTAVVKTMFKFDYGEDCVIISVPLFKKS